MNEQIKFSSYEYVFSNISINKELYMSESFKFINSTFSLFEALQDFIEYTEKNKHNKMLYREIEWLTFLRNYYNHYNSIKNILKNLVAGIELSEGDTAVVKESFKWINKLLQTIFKKEVDSLPHALNSLIAGKFYDRLFFVFKKNEMVIEDFLNIEESKVANLSVIEMVQKEYILNQQLEEEVMQIDTTLSSISQEKQIQLASMWYRTVDFVREYLQAENQKLDTVFPKKAE